jgi:two-component system, NarL family, sensor histidine kinase UhpB
MSRKKNAYSFFIAFFIVTLSFAQSSNTDSLLAVLPQAKEDTHKVNLLRNITGMLRFNNPEKAIGYGLMGIQLSKRLNFDKGTAGCYLNTSTAYLNSYKADTAVLFLDTAIFYSHKAGDPNRTGLAYLNRADAYRQIQNFSQTLKDCDTALLFANRANNDDVRARVYQTIAGVYYSQNLYGQSVAYNEKAIELYKKNGNMRMTAMALNNLALPYKSMQNYTGAIAANKAAIHITDSLKDFANLSIFNGNLSNVYFLMEDYATSEKYADKAMEYATIQKSDNLAAQAMLYKAEIYLKQKKYAAAIAAMTKALPFFKESDDKQNIYLAADILSEAYYATGNFAKAVDYMKMGKEANDSLTKWKYDDDLAALQTKFKVDEKDKAIQLLAKDKELQKQKLRQQWLLMIAAAALALLVLIGAWMRINRNRLRQRMQELELRNQIAADLHDEVGSSLSSIHMLSQMATQQGNEAAHKDILMRMSSNAKETVDKMGDIVWMIKSGETETGSLQQRIERFAYEICSSKNIEAAIQLGGLEKVKLTMEQRKNIYLILKEAINNAVKYADTAKLEITITLQQKELTLLVKDFGKGFDSHLIKKGNGLDNMQHRAKELHGAIRISSEAGKGTTVVLVIPVTAPQK